MSITKRGARSYLVRVPPFPGTTQRTREDAERVELDLKRRKTLGELYEAPPITLGEAIDGTLARLRATGNPSENWMEMNELSAKAWVTMRELPLPAVRRAKVEDMTQVRAEKHRQVREERARVSKACAPGGEGAAASESIPQCWRSRR